MAFVVKLRVGLTGGIGSGKSTVANHFAELGALVIDADVLARGALGRGSVGFARVAQRWPQAISGAGEVDRAALAAVVFSDAAAREELNAIVHPAVRDLGALLEATAGADQIVVHDVPLLFEGGFYRSCDANVLVVAEPALRIARLAARGLQAADVERRMAAQIDPGRAAELADYVIDNDGSLEALREAAGDVFVDLRERIPTVSRGRKRAGEE